MTTKSFISWTEKQALLSSAKRKLESLPEYNRKNHHMYGLSAIDKMPNKEIENLTAAELKSLIDVINNDPSVSSDIKDRIKKGTIRGGIGVNNPIIKYLEYVIIKK
jgi:hypothetical protein